VIARLRFLTDEDFRGSIERGLRRRLPDLDVVRVQDVGLLEVDDPIVLEWAARERRVVLSHDVSTMRRFAYARILQGLPMPGLFLVSQSVPIGRAIEELLLLAECSLEGEWEGKVRFVP
jgi:predicted nuclease of predicted toxin-antitoxin system